MTPTSEDLTQLPVPLKRNGTKIKPFSNMILIITEDCNLRCRYCYEHKKTYSSQNSMSWPTAKKAVDLLLGQIPPGLDWVGIDLFGGEPSLAFDLIKKVIAYSYPHRCIGGYAGKHYNYVINTNGTILTDEMFQLYGRLGKKLNLRVSVDGYKDTHDMSRRTADGKGSWHLVEKNLKYFKTLKERYGVVVNLVSTINKATYKDIYYSYKHLYELTGMYIFSQIIHEEQWEKEDFDVIKEQLLLLQEYRLKKKTKNILCNFFSTKARANSNNHNKGSEFRSICSAGIGSFAVNYNGDIFSCHRAYYYGSDVSHELGNVNTGFNRDRRASMYEINNLKTLPVRCQECAPIVREKCHFCIVSNKEARGDYYAASNGYCSMMQELHQLLLEREKQIREQEPNATTVKAGATVAAEVRASREIMKN